MDQDGGNGDDKLLSLGMYLLNRVVRIYDELDFRWSGVCVCVCVCVREIPNFSHVAIPFSQGFLASVK